MSPSGPAPGPPPPNGCPSIPCLGPSGPNPGCCGAKACFCWSFSEAVRASSVGNSALKSSRRCCSIFSSCFKCSTRKGSLSGSFSAAHSVARTLALASLTFRQRSNSTSACRRARAWFRDTPSRLRHGRNGRNTSARGVLRTLPCSCAWDPHRIMGGLHGLRGGWSRRRVLRQRSRRTQRQRGEKRNDGSGLHKVTPAGIYCRAILAGRSLRNFPVGRDNCRELSAGRAGE